MFAVRQARELDEQSSADASWLQQGLESAAGAGPAVGGPEALGRQWFSAAAAAPEGTETEVPAPVVVVFEGPGVGGDTHFIGGRGDFNFGNPKEQVVSKSKQKWR